MDEGTATAQDIHREILAAEEALVKNQWRVLKLHTDDNVPNEPLLTRLHRLDCEAEDLLLAQEIAAIYVRKGGCISVSAADDMQHIEALGNLLRSRHDSRQTPLYQKLYQDEFLPLSRYLNSHLVLSLCRELRKSNYPSASEELLRQCEENEVGCAFELIAGYCHSLHQLAAIHQQVVSHVEGTASVSTIDQALLELCRPFVERVKFHFVDPSTDRLTSSRTDRLPEWLLTYLRETIFQSGGAWEFIYYALTPHLALDFLNEIIRMVQWVLGERNFFRDPKVTGPASKPLLLCNAVEQLLQFDAFVRDLVLPNQSNRIISLVDVCVAGDEELLHWWLDRERESAFSALWEEEATLPVFDRVSPRAELFCALIRSIQAKASVFSFSGPYLSQVAAPLCVQFLDSIHAAASDLRRVLTLRKLPTDSELESNIRTWIDLINGAHLVATTLSLNRTGESDATTTSGSTANANQDLARFGRSLERLQGVMLDDFVTTVVEVLLMERAKFAGYLMRCSHLLASGDEVGQVLNLTNISPDLFETQRILGIILNLCDGNGDDENLAEEPGNYAPQMMRERLLSVIAEKLVEVALDLQGTTPDLLQPGCALFTRDVGALFGQVLLPKHALRVLDIAKLMRMDSSKLLGIGDALCELAGRPSPLTEATFEVDDKLFEEAISMFRAKGFVYLELADVFAVLNRRRDL